MKQLTICLALVVGMSAGVAFRCSLSSPAEASRGSECAARSAHAIGLDGPARTDRPVSKPPAPIAGASLNVTRCPIDLARETARDGDVVLARIAAECGDYLFAKAKQSSNNAALLAQAAQHYRACLAHEATSPDADALFRDIRGQLDQVEQLLARRDRPTPPAPPRVKSNPPEEVKPPPEEKPAVEKDEPPMVGPDGVIYQRKAKR